MVKLNILQMYNCGRGSNSYYGFGFKDIDATSVSLENTEACDQGVDRVTD